MLFLSRRHPTRNTSNIEQFGSTQYPSIRLMRPALVDNSHNSLYGVLRVYKEGYRITHARTVRTKCRSSRTTHSSCRSKCATSVFYCSIVIISSPSLTRIFSRHRDALSSSVTKHSESQIVSQIVVVYYSPAVVLPVLVVLPRVDTAVNA